jgi:hypothetical protein
MLNLIPSLPLASTYLVLAVSLHFYAREDKRIWSMIALAFATVYAVMASMNYLIQFIVIRPALLSGQTEGLSLWVMGNPHSVFNALANSYPFMSIRMLFAAWALGDGKLERWVRRIFVLIGVTAPIQFAHQLFGVPLVIGLPVVFTWMIGAPMAFFLLASLFRRAGQMAA